MMVKEFILIAGIAGTLFLSFLAGLSCSSPESPYENPENVRIDLVLPDTGAHKVYFGDTMDVRIATYLFSLVDSIKLIVGKGADSLFTSVHDTIPVRLVFPDTGSIEVSATAYCTRGVVKDCRKSLIVHKYPLAPPDSIHILALADTAVRLYWDRNAFAGSYRVFRGISDTGTFTQAAAVMDSFFTDTALHATTLYCYKVLSIDSKNRASDPSKIFKILTSGPSKWDKMKWDGGKWN